MVVVAWQTKSCIQAGLFVILVECLVAETVGACCGAVGIGESGSICGAESSIGELEFEE